MEENKNVEKEMQESLDFGSKAISRSIERRRTMDSFQTIKDITQYLADLSFLLRMSDLIETHGGKVTFTFNDYRDEKEKFEKMYGEYSNIKHSKEMPRYVDYEYDGYADGCPVYDIARCPECGRYFDLDYEEKSNYCPDCGQRLNWDFRELEEEEK